MNILADENISPVLIAELRQQGHEVLDAAELYKHHPDGNLWLIAQHRGCLVISSDTFFEQFLEERHYAVLVVRPSAPDLEKLLERFRYAFNRYGANQKKWRNLGVVIKTNEVDTYRGREMVRKKVEFKT